MFDAIPALCIGRVCEVSGTSIKVELDGKLTELTRTYEGRVYPVGQFASIIKIHFGRIILFGYVSLLRMRSELDGDSPLSKSHEDSRILEADLFGEGAWLSAKNSLEFARGVKTYPLPGQGVFLVTQDEISALFKAAHSRSATEGAMALIGVYSGTASTPCYANIDKLFGMHSAVLGSTGAGKSGTVAAIIHAILNQEANGAAGRKLRPRIILIDPHGEYAKAFGLRCAVFQAYNRLSGDDRAGPQLLKLPYWLMTSEEFRDLVVGQTKYGTATSENNIVYKALAHARLVKKGWIEPAKKWDGKNIKDCAAPDEPRPTDAKHRAAIASYNRDTPDEFSLDEFVRHIEWEQAIKTRANGDWEPMSTSARESHNSVLDKLSVLRADPRVGFMMKEHVAGDSALQEIVAQFNGPLAIEGHDSPDIRIVDISGLPNEVANPLTAAIARLLFEFKVWQTRAERERDPIALVCEEAHRYVPDSGNAEYASAQRAIRRIAKEGRKYGIGLMLVSQRPADVERTVLSQCNSWIVMRLTNTTDKEHVTNFLPDNLAGLSKVLSALSRREALFLGEAAALPARITINELKKEELPDSEDISFSGGWSKTPMPVNEIANVVKRWRREE
ncbi:MAG: ATP-binding protein [Opitutaceae bacterium]|jgi:hypothetical protein